MNKTGSLLRVPFGERMSDGYLIDVHEVANGRACGCICPSCKTPLDAKQGGKNEWHFAHASKAVYEKTERPCEYSIFVAAALMAKQLFQACPAIALPSYEIAYQECGAVTGKQYSTSVRITETSVVQPDSCEVETAVDGIRADVLVKVKDFPLAFYLIHQERPLPTPAFQGHRLGALSIDLEAIPRIFAQASGNSGGYRAALSRFLFEDTAGKQWIYHPREALKQAELAEARERLKTLCAEEGQMPASQAWPRRHTISVLPDYEEPEQYLARYRCLKCDDYEWTDSSRGGNVCPKCHRILYTRELGRVK